MRGRPAQHELALSELVDHAGEIRWIDAATSCKLLQRERVADLEPPQEFRLRVCEPERLEVRALMIKRSREQIHQASHELLARVKLATHYRYFTAFGRLRLPVALLSLAPLVQRLRLAGRLRRLRLGRRVVLVEPPSRLVLRIEADGPLALPEFLRALVRQRSFLAHLGRVTTAAAHLPSRLEVGE